MDRPFPAPPEAEFLSQIGLIAVIGVVALAALGLTIVFPPWAKVRCQRYEVLYYSEQKQVYERSFAGFDFIFSGAKWSSIRTPANAGSGQTFDSTEYNVFRPVLYSEWALIIGSAVALFMVRSRRLRTGIPPKS